MKTMMELLIRLQQLRLSSLRAAHNNQLTAAEKNSIRFFKSLVRSPRGVGLVTCPGDVPLFTPQGECLSAEVLVHYDRLKETEPELLECPEVFAMAVLVSTYRSLSPRKREKLVNHFTTPPRPVEYGLAQYQSQRLELLHRASVGYDCNGHIATRSTPARGRPLRTARYQLVARS
jgi:hypothetical protein